MAQQRIQMDQEKLSCSICLDLLKDPVTIPCGHNYCMDCIKECWDGQYLGQTYSCPQCRQTFRPRPDLKKNTVLADLIEELKKTRLESAPAELCYAGPGDVSCDFCTGRKLKAVKSCLQCLVSYCDQHLQPHYHVAALKNHKLVDPSKKLQENICSGHNEVMKIFCRTDQQCICYLCSLDEHRGHDTVSAAAERNDKQRVVGLNQEKIHQRIQDREKDVRMLQQEVKVINQSADKAVANSEKIFKDLIHLIEKRNSDVKQQIRSKQTDEVRKVRDLEEKLKQELVELRRRSSELEQLSQTEDHIQFLHNYRLMSHLSESTNPANISSVHHLQYFDDVTVAVSKTTDKLQDILKEDWTKTLPRPEDDSGIKTLSPTEPKTRVKLQDILKEDWTKTVPRSGDVSGFKTLSPADPKTRVKLQDVLKEDWSKTSPRSGNVSGFKTLSPAETKTRVKLQDVLKEDWTKTSPRSGNVSGFKTLSPAEPKTRVKLQDVLKEDWCKTSPRSGNVSGFKTLSPAEPKTRVKLQDFLKEDWTKTSPRSGNVSGFKTLSPAETKTRAEFLQYSHHLTLDPNTANRWLLLSEGNRKATVDWTPKLTSDYHPDRFMEKQQVLSRESLTGRCYWEVEQRGATASVAVTYKDISRTGPESKFGYDDRSWALESSSKCTFIHNSIKTPISGARSSRIGVYLDHSAGILSFYRVSDTMTLIHRVQTTFTQPLYAGFTVHGPVELCKLK